MMSIIVVAFFSKSTQQSTMASLYSKNLLSDLAVLSVSEQVIGGIREQIRLKSTVLTREGSVGVQNVYQPIGTDDATVGEETGATTMLGLPQSVSSILTLAPENSWTSDPLGEGKSFSSIKWDRIGLTRSDEIPESGVHQVIESTDNRSKILLVEGKVYDVGGLCDANVAPWGANLSESERKAKSDSYDIDFSKIPAIGSGGANLIGHWLAGSGSSEVDSRLKDYHARGFLSVDEKGRAFLSRQEMLDYLKENQLGGRAPEFLTTFSREVNAPSVRPKVNGSTFSTFESSDLYTFQYKAESNDPWTTKRRKPNRDFAALPLREGNSEKKPVMTKRFPLRRIDLLAQATGSVGVDSDIYKYFGLTRSGENEPWIYSAGTTDEKGNTKIYQLNDPKFISLNREPNFFELLQAGILAGSMGQNSISNDQNIKNQPTTGSIASQEPIFVNADLESIRNSKHVFRIGLNIIDQWDADGYPTMLQIKARKEIFPAVDAVVYYNEAQDLILTGQEGLPSFLALNLFVYRPPVGTTYATPGLAVSQPATLDFVSTWFVPEFWTIERKLNFPTEAPQGLRLAGLCGSMYMTAKDTTSAVIAVPAAKRSIVDYNATRPVVNLNTSIEKLTTSPKLLDTTLAPNNGNGTYPGLIQGQATTSYFGILGPSISLSDKLIDVTLTQSVASFTIAWTGGLIPSPTPTRFDWSYLRKGGSNTAVFPSSDWISSYVYSGMGATFLSAGNAGIVCGRVAGNGNPMATFQAIYGNIPAAGLTSNRPIIASRRWVPDPRTLRFGVQSSNVYVGGNTASLSLPESDIYPWMADSNTRRITLGVTNPVGSLFSPFNILSAKTGYMDKIVPADYGDNRSSGSNPHSAFALSYYKDNDGIVRRGDGNSQYGVYPNHPTDMTSRPIILNRPFTNIAEMGYAYRDLPWKTLDFFSSNSADRDLLDLFTLEEEPEVVAGKINFHGAPEEVLEGLMEGTEIDPFLETKIGQGGGIKSSEIASNILNQRMKIENKTDLVKQLDAVFPQSSDLDTAIKWRRESVIRGLIPSLQTRTWNLCLDLNCQLGKEVGTRTFAGHGSRVWVNVAIDRYTNQIVDRQVEWVQ
ncbi:MAG: hypothetical protein V4507_06810 [Verrucomicrobiota bacterium]